MTKSAMILQGSSQSRQGLPITWRFPCIIKQRRGAVLCFNRLSRSWIKSAFRRKILSVCPAESAGSSCAPQNRAASAIWQNQKTFFASTLPL